MFVVRDQDFELQGPRLVFQAARFVRHEQGQEFLSASRCNFNCNDDCELGHVQTPSVGMARHPEAGPRSCRLVLDQADGWRAL
jgi:hypothetical protein